MKLQEILNLLYYEKIINTYSYAFSFLFYCADIFYQSEPGRGQSLITTITPNGSYMTTSSGMGSLYHFSLEQSGYVILEYNYTIVTSGLKTDELKYTIRFQNCGSDTAFNISERDTINQFLDMNTLHILYSSAPMISQIENNNRIRFTFNNILLPDSGTDELNSQGIIIYSIKTSANVPDFTVVRNNAYIYFDLNDAIKTNTTFNMLVSQLNVGMDSTCQVNRSLIYPNPVTGKSVLTLPDKKKYLLNIYSITGEIIVSVSTSENYVINTNQMNSGIYYYQLIDKDEMKTITGKFVIVK